MSIYPDNKQWKDIPGTKATDHFPFHCRKFLASRHYPAHRHDFLELTFIVAGEGYQIVDNKKYIIRPGTFMFFLPYQVQEMVTESKEPLTLYNCMFDLQFVLSSLGPNLGLEQFLILDEERTPSIQLTREEHGRVEDLFEKLTDEYSNDRMWRKQMILSYLWEVLILFDRLRAEKHSCLRPEVSDHSLNIWAAIRYVHLHYREAITLEMLSRKFAMSSSDLSGRFKKELGLTFTQFLHEIRVRHACSLLASTEMSVLDVAMEVGFGSSRSFFRIFKQCKGMTPSEYRKRLK